MSRHTHRPDTPPPGRRPPTERVEWVPIDFAKSVWGLRCPWCGKTEAQPFPRNADEAAKLCEAFSGTHMGCSGKFPNSPGPPPPPSFMRDSDASAAS